MPTGSSILVTFTDAVGSGSVACQMNGNTPSGGFCLVGPEGMVAATPTVSTDGMTVSYTGLTMDAGAAYTAYVGSDLAPFAENLPTGPIISFTTRTTRPKAAPPTLIAINGGDPANPTSFRPMLITTTIELVFSEPLDARTVNMEPDEFELVDGSDGSGSEIPATIVTDGIHVAIDPVSDLTPGDTYTLKVGAKVLDTGGQAMAPVSATLTPQDIAYQGQGPYPLILRARGSGDPGATSPRFGIAPNVMSVNATLVGANTASFQPFVLQAESSDPRALGGPIAFTLRKGQRLVASGLQIKIGGVVPTNMQTGTIYMELITDANGRMYRDPHQAADITPDNARSPLYIDFTLDIAMYSMDPEGNASLSQVILGLQAVGCADATDGVLDIETFGSVDLGLLGVTSAPVNLDLEMISDGSATPPTDTDAPTLTASDPVDGSASQPVDRGIELVFSEPIDLDAARAGGILLQAGSATVAAEIENHGAVTVIRPLNWLAYNTKYTVAMPKVTDLAGNPLAVATPIVFTTEDVVATSNPMTVTAVHPGAPCALVGAGSAGPGYCSGGAATDDLYHPFTLSVDQPIDVAFTQPPLQDSIALGSACNEGSVRVEQTDNTGACSDAVPGTLLVHERSLEFVPDVPWTAGQTYRLVLESGTSTSCTAGDLCGLTGAASFDPLAGMDGTSAAGGPAIIEPFTAVPSTGATYILKQVTPYTDLNGNGQIDTGEIRQDANRAALQIKGEGGIVSAASFNDEDCTTSTVNGTGDCQYLQGDQPIQIEPVMMSCTLPDGTLADACVPVVLDPGSMYGTSMSMSATVEILSIIPISTTTSTETTVLRVRQPPDGPLIGMMFDNNGTPTFIVQLSVYMDAPDMSVELSTDDLHSKPLTLLLEGPVSFTSSGRLQIDLQSQADVPVTINISNTFGNGSVDLVIPAGDMKLQLISKPLRGSPP